jgi:hypothetical protein
LLLPLFLEPLCLGSLHFPRHHGLLVVPRVLATELSQGFHGRGLWSTGTELYRRHPQADRDRRAANHGH